MGEKMVMPNLSALFRYKGPCFSINEMIPQKPLLSKKMKDYVDKELKRLSGKKKKLEKLANSQNPVYVWGIGREFLYLYEAAGLKRCNIMGLIDMNPFKQKTVTLNGKHIISPNILHNVGNDAVLAITAIAHESMIAKYVAGIPFNGTILSIE
jgi:hypothetical protein